MGDSQLVRVPNDAVDQAVVDVSRRLEQLSASFLVDAGRFFSACNPKMRWRKLTSLILTSELLNPDQSAVAIDTMLHDAAAVALRMPKLETMEIWTGQEGSAMLFRYQVVKDEKRSIITRRGTWRLVMWPRLVQAWEAVALQSHGGKLTVVEELLEGRLIKSHGDAIHHLEVSKSVIRPMSLHQIRLERRIAGRGGEEFNFRELSPSPTGQWWSDSSSYGSL